MRRGLAGLLAPIGEGDPSPDDEPRAARDDQPGDDADECDHQTLLRVRAVLRAAALTVAPCGRRGRDFLTSGRRSAGATESAVITGCCDRPVQGTIGCTRGKVRVVQF